MRSWQILSLITLTLVSLNAHAIFKSCSKSLNGAASIYRASDLNSELLNSFVGANVSLSGKYRPHDPNDQQKLEGEGIVMSTASWTQDDKPYATLRIMTETGPKEFAILPGDKSISIKLLQPAKLKEFEKFAEEKGLRIKRSGFGLDINEMMAFLREQQNQTLHILYVGRSEDSKKPTQLELLRSSATKAPTNEILARNYIFGKPTLVEFQTQSGVVQLDMMDIISIIY